MSNGVLVGIITLLDGDTSLELAPFVVPLLERPDLPPNARDGVLRIASAALKLKAAREAQSASVEPQGASTAEAAQHYGVGIPAIRARCRRGSLPAWKHEGQWVIDVAGVTPRPSEGAHSPT
jgi:hypothetical protein